MRPNLKWRLVTCLDRAATFFVGGDQPRDCRLDESSFFAIEKQVRRFRRSSRGGGYFVRQARDFLHPRRFVTDL